MTAAGQATVRRVGAGAALAVLALGAMLRAADPSPGPAGQPPRERVPLPAFDGARFTTETSSHYTLNFPPEASPAWFYYPPFPPVLGTELPVLKPLAHGTPAPAALAPFVDDPFYARLALRLVEGDLSPPLGARLEAYRTERRRRQDEIRAALAAAQGAAPAERAATMQALAVAQEGPLRALEAEAEALRSDLQPAGLAGALLDRDDWPGNPGRQPAGGADAAWSWAEESELLLGAAYFQAGLSPAQRRLLRATVREPEGGAARSAVDGSFVIPFEPEPARVRLTGPLEGELGRRIDRYLSDRRAIQDELRATFRHFRRGGAHDLTDALRTLAAAQAPRFAALSTEAEAIRGMLAARPDREGAAPPALPAALAERITAYRAHKTEALKAVWAMLAAPANPRGRAPGLVPAPAPADFEARQREILDPLGRELAGIRAALADFVRAGNRPADRKAVDDLLRDFESARQRQELADRYRDYAAAVLQPGLSPLQRRLLFSSAVEQLDLPLPDGRPEGAP